MCECIVFACVALMKCIVYTQVSLILLQWNGVVAYYLCLDFVLYLQLHWNHRLSFHLCVCNTSAVSHFHIVDVVWRGIVKQFHFTVVGNRTYEKILFTLSFWVNNIPYFPLLSYQPTERNNTIDDENLFVLLLLLYLVIQYSFWDSTNCESFRNVVHQ